ncbi:MAG: hypothetical protein J6C87_08465 [Bacteroides sp.]|nr:hypothetical protein [Bacteroides sp.]
MKGLYIVVLTSLISLCACHSTSHSDLLPGFEETQTLAPIDSINLEELDILNPGTMLYKDSFLIFRNGQGRKEMHLLDLKANNRVYRYEVVGQGPGQMSTYRTEPSNRPHAFNIFDLNRGRLYTVDLEKVRRDAMVEHTLLHTLPNRDLFRCVETENRLWGLGIPDTGRVWMYEKQSGVIKKQGEYPASEEIEGLSQFHKGTLFSRTYLETIDNHLVLATWGVFDFYKFATNGTLKLLRRHTHHLPQFTYRAAKNIIGINGENTVGAFGLTSGKEGVYLLYTSKMLKDKSYEYCHDLYSYDWEGNPLQHYYLTKSVAKIALAEGGILYGLCREGTPRVYIYSLPQEK